MIVIKNAKSMKCGQKLDALLVTLQIPSGHETSSALSENLPPALQVMSWQRANKKVAD
jgi:hypothetical protein